ncbi:hypothetical protein PQ43W_19 [Ralstonia phage PQ43W]
MMLRPYLLLVLLLAGCASEPQIVYKPQRVEVPVAVPCKVKAPDKPTWGLSGASVTDDIYVKGRAALAEILQRQAYEAQLEAAVGACQ